MRYSKTLIDNYKIVANYLHMRTFDLNTASNLYYSDSIKKVDNRIRKEGKNFDTILKEAKDKIRKDKIDERKKERLEKKHNLKVERLKSIAVKFIENTNNGVIPFSTKQYCKPYVFNKNLFLKGSYRRNTGAGYFYVNTKIGEKFNVQTFIENDWNTYAKNCYFPCRNYQTYITLPKNGFFCLIGGLWTWINKIDRKGCKAAWVEQTGLECYPVYGFLVNGYHVSGAHAKTLKEARKYVLAIRLKQRAKDLKLSKKTYTIADSLHAGNCEAGSLAFANAHNIDPNGKYTGKFLLSIATDNEMPFVRRFVK